MTIQQLLYVIEIDNRKSFNQAADALYISQSTLSRTVSALEDELGIILFERSNKGIETTKDGKVFIESARNITKQFTQLKKMWSSNDNSTLSSSIRIASIHNSFVTETFIKLCKNFSNEEMLDFSLQILSTPKIIQSVAQDQHELGIIWFSDTLKEARIQSIVAKGLNFTSLYRAPLKILLNKSDPLAQKGIITLSDLDEYTYVTFDPYLLDTQLNDLKAIDEFNILNNRKTYKTIVCSERHIALELIKSIRGFTFAYNQHQLYSEKYNLTCLKLNNPILYTELGYITKQKKTPSPIVSQFISLLTKEFNDYRSPES